MRLSFFFFFQAEDGIRDLTVTGVQTCALPIFDVSENQQELGSEVAREDGRREVLVDDGVDSFPSQLRVIVDRGTSAPDCDHDDAGLDQLLDDRQLVDGNGTGTADHTPKAAVSVALQRVSLAL